VDVVRPPTPPKGLQRRASIRKTTELTKVGTAVGYTPKMVAFEGQHDEARAQAAVEQANYLI
jgi:hypothetical protein